MNNVRILPLEQGAHPLDQQEGVFFEPREVYRTHNYNGIARIAGAEIEYTYEAPFHLEDDVPILLANGYGAVKSAYFPLRRHIASQGKPAISFRPPRSQAKFGDFHPSHFFHPNRLQSQAAWAVMRDLQKNLGVDKFDLMGHSMGGQTIANVATHKPEHIRSVVFAASAGLDKHNIKIMRERTGVFLREELAPALGQLAIEHNPKIAPDTLHYVFRNIKRTLLEGLSVANCDIRVQVVGLGRLGIKTAALQFAADRLFPLHGVMEHSGNIFDVFKVYPNPNAGHLAPQLEPKNVAQFSIDLIRELNS